MTLMIPFNTMGIVWISPRAHVPPEHQPRNAVSRVFYFGCCTQTRCHHIRLYIEQSNAMFELPLAEPLQLRMGHRHVKEIVGWN